MKPFSYFSSIIILVLFTGCFEPDCCDLPNSNNFFVELRNNEGLNLFDPKTDGSIDLNKTRLFLLENGQVTMVKYESSGAILDYPYGVLPFEEKGEYGVKFFFDYTGVQRDIEGIIQWDEVRADTLNFTFNSAETSTFLSKISQNGKILWDVTTDPENEILIVLEH